MTCKEAEDGKTQVKYVEIDFKQSSWVNESPYMTG